MATLPSESDSGQSMFHLLKGSRTDRLLLLVSLLLIAIAWFVIQSRVSAGPAVAEIYHDQLLLATYPLPQSGESSHSVIVQGELGETEIVLDEQGVRMKSSPCSSQHCVLSGAHKHAGEIIACVPNRILVTVRGKSASDFDAIVE